MEPQAYYAADILRGGTLGTADFHKPQDVFVAPDGRVYIADTGNNRILRLSAALELEAVIDSFDNNGKADGFASPSGVFVTGEGRLYVADTCLLYTSGCMSTAKSPIKRRRKSDSITTTAFIPRCSATGKPPTGFR